ncbi:MAG: hypothetical protein Q4P65_04125 [Eubacteriales bacterium]|nr:hypothetical protein [Eubacteriales bacterium]
MIKRKFKNQDKALILGLWLLLFSCLPLGRLQAQDTVYLDYPQSAARGSNFQIKVYLGQAETIQTVQLFLAFDPSSYTYVPEGSYLLDPNLESGLGHDIEYKLNNEHSASLALIHWDGDIPTDGTIAVLNFYVPEDAPIAPAAMALAYSPNNAPPFVSTAESGKIEFKTEQIISLDIIVSELPPAQEAPILPGENTPGKLEIHKTSPSGDSGDIAEPGQNSVEQTDSTQEQNSQPAANVSNQDSQPDAAVELLGDKLLDIDGNELFVPEDKPVASEIPAGFGLEQMSLHEHDITAIHNRETGKSYYYLRRDAKAAYYSYDSALERFKLEDLSELFKEEREQSQKTFERQQKPEVNRKLWLIVLLAVLALALIVLLVAVTMRFLRRV